jgi:hypothetical protein
MQDCINHTMKQWKMRWVSSESRDLYITSGRYRAFRFGLQPTRLHLFSPLLTFAFCIHHQHPLASICCSFIRICPSHECTTSKVNAPAMATIQITKPKGTETVTKTAITQKQSLDIVQTMLLGGVSNIEFYLHQELTSMQLSSITYLRSANVRTNLLLSC